MTTRSTPDLEERIFFCPTRAAASPFYQQMGIGVDSLEEARAILRLDATGAHLNADGIVHGGVLPSLADAAMGCALRTLHGDGAQLLTIEGGGHMPAVRDPALFNRALSHFVGAPQRTRTWTRAMSRPR